MSASAKTDRTDYRSRVFHAETHLIDIEGCLITLSLLDESNFQTPDPEHEALVYLISRLHNHAGALRKTLFPKEQTEKGSAS